MKQIVRRAGRWLLGILTRLTIAKHRPTIIAITGDGQTSVAREVLYYVLREGFPVRRNLELPEAEFSVPITVFDYPNYPTSKLEWLWLVVKVFGQLFTVRPYSHVLVLELAPTSQQVFDSWLRSLHPQTLVIIGDTNLQLPRTGMQVMKVPDEMDEINDAVSKVAQGLGIDEVDIELGLTMVNFPEPRVRFLTGAAGQVIVDATHYYFPLKLNSVLELVAGFSDRKIAFTPYELDIQVLQENGWEVNPRNYGGRKGDVVILRGRRTAEYKKYKDKLGKLD